MFKKRFFAMLLSICVMFAVMPMSIAFRKQAVI